MAEKCKLPAATDPFWHTPQGKTLQHDLSGNVAGLMGVSVANIPWAQILSIIEAILAAVAPFLSPTPTPPSNPTN